MEKTGRGFVYIWYDRKHKRFYIGSHWGREDDRYICSSKWMRNSYRRRPQDFRRKILARIYTNREDLLEEEYKWLQLIKDEELRIKYYNLSKKHFGHWSTNEDKALSIREKVSISKKEFFKNNPKAIEANRLQAKLLFQKNPRRLVEAANKYYEKNPEVKKERIKKMQEYYEKNPDKKEEVKAIFAKNLRDYHDRQRLLNGKFQTPSGIFDNQTEACIVTGISKCTLYRRIKDDKYPMYKRII